MYGRSAVRVLRQRRRAGLEERVVFVIGSPRSGTTFLGESLGAQPGFVDLSEVTPLKAALPQLAEASEDEAARRIRHIVEWVRRLALARRVRAVEQTPEMSFFVSAALRAYPQARAVHIVRDGRDVVSSLLERGWLKDAREEADDAGLRYGPHARFWVEPERADEFLGASEATRAAWAWRRYVTAARRSTERTLEIRYESLVADPAGTAGGSGRAPRQRPGASGGGALARARTVCGPLARGALVRPAGGRRARGRAAPARARLPEGMITK